MAAYYLLTGSSGGGRSENTAENLLEQSGQQVFGEYLQHMKIVTASIFETKFWRTMEESIRKRRINYEKGGHLYAVG